MESSGTPIKKNSFFFVTLEILSMPVGAPSPLLKSITDNPSNTSNGKNNNNNNKSTKYKNLVRTNQRSQHEIEPTAEVVIEDLRHIIVELRLHSAIAGVALISGSLTERHFQ